MRPCPQAEQQDPPRLIGEGGIPAVALIAQVVISKYAEHLPLYRLAQIYARQGIQLDRSTLAALRQAQEGRPSGTVPAGRRAAGAPWRCWPPTTGLGHQTSTNGDPDRVRQGGVNWVVATGLGVNEMLYQLS